MITVNHEFGDIKYCQFYTISELFDWIEEATNPNTEILQAQEFGFELDPLFLAEKIIIEYDSIYGIPVLIHFDYIFGIADEEFSYRIEDFEILN